jgi:hypothetical protein
MKKAPVLMGCTGAKGNREETLIDYHKTKQAQAASGSARWTKENGRLAPPVMGLGVCDCQRRNSRSRASVAMIVIASSTVRGKSSTVSRRTIA